jgi:hypothetical protein
MKQRSNFLGTYFNKNIVLRVSAAAKIFSWVVMGIYGVEFLVQIIATILQISRGYWTGMVVTDVLVNILSLFEQPLRGVVYFIVLQAAAEVILMLMDLEDNTRMAVRDRNQE